MKRYKIIPLTLLAIALTSCAKAPAEVVELALPELTPVQAAHTPEAPVITPTPEPTPAPLPDIAALEPGSIIDEAAALAMDPDKRFICSPIEAGDAVYQRINGKSYTENKYIPLSELRYIKLLHYNFDGAVQVGELIANVALAQDYREIFAELFQNRYQIQSMYLVDNYWVGNGTDSDTNSIDHNNTSAFCYRKASNASSLSQHGYGRAIDINPQQNPYVTISHGKPKWEHENANDYIARDTGLPHVITHDDLCYKVFKKHGFDWGGDWENPLDYQHFSKADE